MADYPLNVGAVIKTVRQSQGLSLDRAAKLTGVSKAMLGQIERGESSPTVSTLWKVSTGLRITFSRLLGSGPTEYSVTELADIAPVREARGQMLLYNVFPFDPVTGFDYFYIELKPGCRYESPSHPNVVEEGIVVTQGMLKMEIEGQAYLLTQGASIKFPGAARHIYANETEALTVFQNLIRY